MLNFRTVADLVARMRADETHINSVLNRFPKLVEKLAISHPAKPGKIRYVHSARPPLRGLQSQFYRYVLLHDLPRSHYSHGGLPGRSIRTNAAAHIGQSWVFTTDITEFFPSIRYERVQNLFCRLGCSDDVAALCTRICTHQQKLAQGFVTSPIIADQMMYQVDQQLATACEKLGLVYTRYVDDISVSGPFNFEKSGIPKLIRRILMYNGFHAKEEKEQFGSLKDGKVAITKLRVMGKRLDVQGQYLNEVERQLRDHARLGSGGEFQGPYYTSEQLWGRVQFIVSINPKRVKHLHRLLFRINWKEVQKQAISRKLVTPAGPTIGLVRSE